MKTLTHFETSIVQSLYKHIGKATTIKEWLEHFYFKNDNNCALIIQSHEHYGVFFLKKEVFDNSQKKQDKESEFNALICFLKYLNTHNYITINRGKKTRGTPLFYIQDNFKNPQPTKNSIILNSSGDYTENPSTIQNNEGHVIYDGITYDNDIFDLILNTCTGSLFVSKSLETLLKKPKPQRKNRISNLLSFSILLIIIAIITFGYFKTPAILKIMQQSDVAINNNFTNFNLRLDSLDIKLDTLMLQRPKNSIDTTNVKKEIELNKTGKDSLYGIDISKWNKSIINQPSVIENSGLTFIICKATEGITYTDPTFKTNWRKIHKYKLIRGAYHFYRTNDDPIEQAEHFVKVLGKLKNTDIAPILDIEDGSIVNINLIDEKNLQIDLMLFLRQVEKLTGKKPIIYTNKNFADTYLLNKRFSEYRLWLAEYTGGTTPIVPITWKDKGWAIWQKTDSYLLNNNYVDYDVFIGDTEDLIQ